MVVSELTAPALRVTPMTVLDDISSALRRYEALGFARVESGNPGCIGMQDVRTRGGTRETLMDDSGHLFILAERLV